MLYMFIKNLILLFLRGILYSMCKILHNPEYLSILLFVYLFVCLFVCQFVFLYVFLFVFDSTTGFSLEICRQGRINED